jgi:hypothetical protein
VAVYNARIDVTVSGQNRLDYVLASVEKLNSIVSKLKPINLLAPGAGEGGDKIRQAKKQLDDFARALVNFEPQGIQKRARELSNTLAGSAAQADALGVALANAGLKSGGFKQQAAEVRNYALALDTAAQNADRLNAINRSVQRGARLENIAARFGTTPEAVEQRINNIRDIRYRKQKEAEADEYMQQKRAEDFELRLNKIMEKRQQAKQARTTAENVALGAGFPLLFGGGPGSVIGGALGGLIPGNPMLSVVTSAIGDQLDAAIVKVQTIGNSIKTLNFNALTESGIKLNSEILTQLNLLMQVGDALAVQKILSQEIARETGTLPGVTEDVTGSVNLVQDAWRKFLNSVSTTLGILSAPFAAALAGILEAVTAIFKVFNGLFSLIGTGIKTAAEFVIELVAGKDAAENIRNNIDKTSASLAEATAKAEEFRNTLNQTNVRLSIDLQAARQLTPGLTSEDKIKNIQTETQRELNILYQDEAETRVKIRQENVKASAEAVKGLLLQNDAIYRKKRELVEINSSREIETVLQRDQLERERKTTQELEKQRKELERVAKLRKQQLDRAQKNYVLAEAQVGIVSATDDISRKQAEYDKTRAERMYTFSELLGKGLSEQEKQFLVETQFLVALAAEIQLKQDIADINKKQTADLYSQLGVSELLTLNFERMASFAGAGKPALPFNPNMNLVPSITGGELGAEAERARLELEKLIAPAQQVASAAEGIGSAFANSFKGVVSGAMTAQEALASFFQSVADRFLDMAAQIIAKWIEMTILNTVLSLFPGGTMFKGAGPVSGTAAFSGAGMGAKGFLLPQILPGRAAGGPVSAGSPYIVGEKGPELFVPGRSGGIVPNNQLGGDTTNVVVNVDASGSKVQGDEPKANELARAVSAAVQAELVKQKRPGGLLA